MRFNLQLLILFIILLVLVLALNYSNKTVNEYLVLSETNSTTASDDCGVYGCIDDYIDFEGFDNETGSDKMIVPNIVHLIYLQQTTIKFHNAICIFSIFHNHKPDLIYIHCDNCSFHGKYWEWLKGDPDLWKIIKIHQVPTRNTIFGRKYGWIHHRSDVLRLEVLMNYGGIYLDNDMHVINPLHKYRHFEMTISWDSRDVGLGNQIFIAHRNARYLRMHYDSYRHNYSAGMWYWNGGLYPTEVIKQNQEYLAHSVKNKFGTHMLIHRLYKSYYTDWKTYDCMHLLINHRSYLDKESPIKDFDEFNIMDYNYTYGYMVREILKQMKKI